jgi:hypothetical protein
MQRTDIEITKGDTYSRTLTVTQRDGTVYDLTASTIWLTIKPENDIAASDAGVVIDLYWVSGGASSGITVGTPTSGVMNVKILPTSTELLVTGSLYRYDVQISKGGDIYTTVYGLVSVVPDVTRRTTTP